MSIQILKLVNGDDIISDVEINRDDKKTMILKNPARIMMFPTEDGQMGMGLAPWCPYTSQEEFVVSCNQIIISIDPPNDLRNQYIEHFGSGLVAPPTGLII